MSKKPALTDADLIGVGTGEQPMPQQNGSSQKTRQGLAKPPNPNASESDELSNRRHMKVKNGKLPLARWIDCTSLHPLVDFILSFQAIYIHSELEHLELWG